MPFHVLPLHWRGIDSGPLPLKGMRFHLATSPESQLQRGEKVVLVDRGKDWQSGDPAFSSQQISAQVSPEALGTTYNGARILA